MSDHQDDLVIDKVSPGTNGKSDGKKDKKTKTKEVKKTKEKSKKQSSGPGISKPRLYVLLKVKKTQEEKDKEVQKKIEKKDLKEQKKVDKAEFKVAKRTSKDKPKYEDEARPGLDEAIDALGQVLGAGEQLDALIQLRVDTSVLATQGKYTEAIARLKDVKKLVETGRKVAKEAEKEARKTFSKIFSWAEELKNKLAEDGQDLSDQYQKNFLAEINVALTVLFHPDAGGDEADMVDSNLDALAKDLIRQVSETGKAKEESGKQLIDARTLLENLKDCVTTGEYARMKQLVDGAATAIQERDYVAAGAALTEVLSDGGTMLDTATDARTDWEKCATELKNQLKAARELAGKRAIPMLHEIEPTAGAVRDGFEELENDLPPDVVSYAEATITYNLLSAALVDLQQRAGEDKAMSTLRQQANQRVLAAGEEVDAALEDLHEFLENNDEDRDPSDLDGPFVQEKEDVLTAWANVMRRITDDKTLLKVSMETQKKLSDIVIRIGTTCTDIDSFTDAVDSRDLEIARDEFETSHANCLKLIDQVMAMDVPAGVMWSDRLRDLVAAEEQATSVTAVEKLTKRVQILGAKTNMQIQALTKESETAQSNAGEALIDAEGKLGEFTELIAAKSKLDWLREPTKEKEYGAMRDGFKDRLDEQRPLARMLDPIILEECTVDLTELSGQLRTAIGAVQGGKDAKGVKFDTVGSMTAELDKLSKRINTHDLSKYLTERQLGLAEQVDPLSASLRSLPIETAREQIDDLARLVAEAERDAGKARLACKQFEKECQGLRKLMKGDAFKDAPDYRKTIEGKLDKLFGDAVAGGVTTDVRAEFIKIETEVSKAATDPQARKTGQGDAEKEKREAELAAAEWKSRYEIVVEAIKKSTGIVFDKKRDELMELAKSANQVYEKSKDMQAATMQLRIVNDRLEFLEKYPDGMEIAARNKLPQLRDRWKQSVGDLKSGLDDLAQLIGKLDPADVPPAGAKAVVATISTVKNLFNPVLFDATVDAMAGKKLSRKQLSAAREATLRAVHNAQTIIEKDPRMMDFARNPFLPGIDRLIANANLALAELETNLLISL